MLDIGHWRQRMKLVVRQLLGDPSQAMAFLVHFAVGRMRAPVDSDLPQKIETGTNAARELAPHRVQVRPKPGHLRASLHVRATLR